MAELVTTKSEQAPDEENASAIYGYFKGTPTDKELGDAVTSKYGEDWDADDVSYEPTQYQDEVADLAGLERWYLCQHV